MNFAVCSCSIREVLIEALVISVNVCYIPSVDIGRIFKVEENFGALTKAKGCCSNKSCVMNECCCKCTCKICGSICFAYRREVKTVKCTELIICNLKYYVIFIDNNFIKTAVNCCLETDCDFLIKRNCHNRLCEGKFCRNNDFN